MKNILATLLVSVLALAAAPLARADDAAAPVAVSAPATGFDVTIKTLQAHHLEFLINHGLDVAFDLAIARQEVTTAPDGAPVSLLFDLDGVSAFYVAKDGTVVHLMLKAHRTRFALPEGVQIAFSLGQGEAKLFEFNRVYGLLELGNIKADVQTAIQSIQSKEWRETTLGLAKLLLCAQLPKLNDVHALPAVVTHWIIDQLTPTCSQ